MKTTTLVVRLQLLTPGGVTAPEAVRAVERRDRDGTTSTRNVLPLRRDPAGAVVVPASTVAGSLRAHCADRPALAGLFGSEPETPEKDLVASAIQVLDCRLVDPAGTVERTRTAIDRERGAAANRTLHAIEQLLAGTRFDVVLRWDNAPPVQLDAFVAALLDWRPAIGRGTSLGAGQCEIVGLGREDHDLGTVDGLVAWLALAEDGAPDHPEPQPVAATGTPRAELRSVRFTIVDALHVGSGEVVKDAAGHEVALVVRDGNRCVIPASSLKGVLRSRIEYLCRLCGGHACPAPSPSTCDLNDPCPPCRLFGRAAAPGSPGRSRRGVVAISDAAIEDEIVERRTHVAIDRFTGGAHDRLLYTDEVVVGGKFTIRMTALDGEPTETELALLDAALADLADGLIGLGARTTAGYGTVALADDRWTAPDLSALAGLLEAGSR